MVPLSMPRIPPAIKRALMIELYCRMNNGSSKDLNSDQVRKMMELSADKCCKKAFYRLPASLRFEKEGDFISIVRKSTKCDR